MSKTAVDKRPFDRGAFFRTCRMLHTYVSAFAFMALLFFSVTGLLLNHPEWFESYEPSEHEASVTLSRAEMDQALKAPEPGRAIAARVAAQTSLRGAYASADRQDETMLVRLDGPKGTSDLDVDLRSGVVRARVTRSNLTAVLLDLHRGKNSGAAWRWVIDLTAWIVLALSIIGFVLFFSLRLRLRSSMVLAVAGLFILTAIGAWLVA